WLLWLHDGHLHAVLERHVTSSLRPFSSDALRPARRSNAECRALGPPPSSAACRSHRARAFRAQRTRGGGGQRDLGPWGNGGGGEKGVSGGRRQKWRSDPHLPSARPGEPRPAGVEVMDPGGIGGGPGAPFKEN